MDFNDFKCFWRWMALRESLSLSLSLSLAHPERLLTGACCKRCSTACSTWPSAHNDQRPCARGHLRYVRPRDAPNSVQFALARAKIEIPQTECSSWLDGSFQRPSAPALMAILLREDASFRKAGGCGQLKTWRCFLGKARKCYLKIIFLNKYLKDVFNLY